MDGPSFPSQRKRPRFSYDEPDPDEEDRRERKPRFPKGKKESQKFDREFELEECIGPIKLTDPRVAATERAGRRGIGLDNLEETSLPEDVYGAEEDYQESFEARDEGITIEPFNLKQEREEGYFDAEGNYVEYRNNNIVKDAWLDTAEVDTSLAAKHMKQYAKEEVEHDLSAKELAAIKRRITNALLPGETVLKALRRLKASSTSKDKHVKTKMSSQAKEAFDSLTEDAMKLLDHGEYNVYDETKETFQREAEGYESLEKAKLKLEEGTSSSFDMFGDDDNEPTKVTGATDSKLPPRYSAETSEDMFSADDNKADKVRSTEGGDIPVDSGYVYDETSGFYYNSSIGYYYDGNTGLFCNAATGKWFRFDEENNSYLEILEEQIEQ